MAITPKAGRAFLIFLPRDVDRCAVYVDGDRKYDGTPEQATAFAKGWNAAREQTEERQLASRLARRQETARLSQEAWERSVQGRFYLDRLEQYADLWGEPREACPACGRPGFLNNEVTGALFCPWQECGLGEYMPLYS